MPELSVQAKLTVMEEKLRDYAWNLNDGSEVTPSGVEQARVAGDMYVGLSIQLAAIDLASAIRNWRS